MKIHGYFLWQKCSQKNLVFIYRIVHHLWRYSLRLLRTSALSIDANCSGRSVFPVLVTVITVLYFEYEYFLNFEDRTLT